MNQKITPEQQKMLQEKLSKLSPEQLQELIQRQCLFCKIVKGEIPAYTIYEDDSVIAFLDIQPATLGHTLVISKKHYSVLPQMPDEEASHLMVVVKQLAGLIFEAMHADGVEIRQRNGEIAGQVIPHVHFHITPRYKDDGQEMLNEPYNPLKLTEKQFKDVQKQIAPITSRLSVKKTQKKEETKDKPVRERRKIKNRLP